MLASFRNLNSEPSFYEELLPYPPLLDGGEITSEAPMDLENFHLQVYRKSLNNDICVTGKHFNTDKAFGKDNFEAHCSLFKSPLQLFHSKHIKSSWLTFLNYSHNN